MIWQSLTIAGSLKAKSPLLILGKTCWLFGISGYALVFISPRLWPAQILKLDKPVNHAMKSVR